MKDRSLAAKKAWETKRNTIDPQTGLSIAELSRIKRREKLSELQSNGKTLGQQYAIDRARIRKSNINPETGLSRQQEIANKMKETKRNTKDIYGRDTYQLTAIKTAITRFGQYGGFEGSTKFEIYSHYVNLVTKQQPLEQLKNFEKRAAYGKTNDPHQIDHKYSKIRGFLENIPPYIIGHISNLEMLPSRTNNSKGSNCSISQDELFSNFFKS